MDWTSDKIDNRDKGPKLSDLVEMLDLPSGADFKAIRMIGPSRRVAKHYLPVFKNDGTAVMKNGQQVKIPKVCLAYNGKTNTYEGKCPYCDMDPDTPKIEVHTNVLDREEQEAEPQKKKPRTDKEKKAVKMNGFVCHVKEGKTGAWTPARFMIIKSSVGGKISDYTQLNKRKGKDGEVKKFGPEHPKYGFDMQIKFDKSKSGSEMYAVVKDEKTSLSEDELGFLLWDINTEQPEDFETAKKEAASFAKRIKAGTKGGDDSDDDDDAPKKKKGGKSSKKSAEDDDWDEDEDFESDGDDDDDDDRPKKKSKPSKKKSRDEDDEDEEDDDWGDDDEDEKPKKGKKPTKKSRSSDDDDDEDEDDEDDRPAKKKKPAGKSSKKSRDEDDDDDDDWDSDSEEEDDEDDDEPPRRKSSGKVKSKKPVKRSRDEDEDEDDEDAPWDDDEEEEKPKKKKKKPADDDDDEEEERPRKKSSKAPVKKKRRPEPEDDDDDDWDD